MIESRVEVSIDGPTHPIVISAGQSLRIGRNGEMELGVIDGDTREAAWSKRQLVVRNRPLAEVLDELSRHRPGLIHYDKSALAGMNVSAVLPLADTDRSLQLLANNFPALQIRTLTPYLVIVEREKNR